jgi:ABC-2 type transport system permease protein
MRRGESLLLTLGIPVGLLLFFSVVDVLPLPDGITEPVDFLAPGIIALAVMSTAMVGLGIATGFERHYLVLKRLGATPLGRPALLAAKIASVVVVEMMQLLVLVPIALLLGWSPATDGLLVAFAAVIVGTVAFAGIGLLLAGRLSGEVNLAAQNGLYLVLLLFGGIIIPNDTLPAGLGAAAKLLPSTALSTVLHGALTDGFGVPGWAWLVLIAWALAAPLAAALTFRWE